MTLVHLIIGFFAVWFTFYAVADHIKDRQLKKLINARDDESQRRSKR